MRSNKRRGDQRQANNRPTGQPGCAFCSTNTPEFETITPRMKVVRRTTKSFRLIHEEKKKRARLLPKQTSSRLSVPASLSGWSWICSKKQLTYWANTNTTILMDKYENNYWAKSVNFGSTVDGWRRICRFYSLKTELFSQFFLTLFKSVISLVFKMLKASTEELLSPSTYPTHKQPLELGWKRCKICKI